MTRHSPQSGGTRAPLSRLEMRVLVILDDADGALTVSAVATAAGSEADATVDALERLRWLGIVRRTPGTNGAARYVLSDAAVERTHPRPGARHESQAIQGQLTLFGAD